MDRLLLTLGLVLVVLVVAYGFRAGWRSRNRRQIETLALPELSEIPADLGEPIAEISGVYSATTTAGHWQDRVVDRELGRRARATVCLYPQGVLIDRVAEQPIFVPVDALVAVDTAPGIAGKVMGMAGGVLIVTWQLGQTRLDSGIRADDLVAQTEWIIAARALIAQPTS